NYSYFHTILDLKNLAREPGVYEKIAKSIAPAIYGSDDIKRSIACLLFAGSSKRLPDGLKRRGDINVLLLGDPVSPIGVYTSGKGSSAAGLTASVIRDPSSRAFVLEGGAMVLADGGVVCIDEFDKMREDDRVAIHEAMEQQTISIAKAGITTTLNSRCAVFAAANSVFGRWDDTKGQENIDFMPTILSRFDMIFVVKDEHDEKRDITLVLAGKRDFLEIFYLTYHVKSKRAKHVIGVHTNAGEIAENHPEDAASSDELTLTVLKKYIAYCRQNCAPRLSNEAARKLVANYVKMRNPASENTTNQRKSAIPITGNIFAICLKSEFTVNNEFHNVRNRIISITLFALEALIRISESLAKMELSPFAVERHVDEACRLFQISTLQAAKTGKLSGVEGFTTADEQELLNRIEKQLKSRLAVGTQVSEHVVLQDFIRQRYAENDVRKVLLGLVRRGEIQYRLQRKMLYRKIFDFWNFDELKVADERLEFSFLGNLSRIAVSALADRNENFFMNEKFRLMEMYDVSHFAKIACQIEPAFCFVAFVISKMQTNDSHRNKSYASYSSRNLNTKYPLVSSASSSFSSSRFRPTSPLVTKSYDSYLSSGLDKKYINNSYLTPSKSLLSRSTVLPNSQSYYSNTHYNDINRKSRFDTHFNDKSVSNISSIVAKYLKEENKEKSYASGLTVGKTTFVSSLRNAASSFNSPSRSPSTNTTPRGSRQTSPALSTLSSLRSQNSYVDRLNFAYEKVRTKFSSSAKEESNMCSNLNSRSEYETNFSKKSSWGKHYEILSSRWAENTGSTLNTPKEQYSYRPTSNINSLMNSSAPPPLNLGSKIESTKCINRQDGCNDEQNFSSESERQSRKNQNANLLNKQVRLRKRSESRKKTSRTNNEESSSDDETGNSLSFGLETLRNDYEFLDISVNEVITKKRMDHLMIHELKPVVADY
uniref:DNA helicase n=1 Tax=Romanomermis culicivorax TaxID=13658 RepID=A0A915I9V6_ROMCU